MKLRLKEYTLIDNRVGLLWGRKHENKGQEGAGTFLRTSCANSPEQLNSSKPIRVLLSEEYCKFLVLQTFDQRAREAKGGDWEAPLNRGSVWSKDRAESDIIDQLVLRGLSVE